jgi:hypothetical protein
MSFGASEILRLAVFADPRVDPLDQRPVLGPQLGERTQSRLIVVNIHAVGLDDVHVELIEHRAAQLDHVLGRGRQLVDAGAHMRLVAQLAGIIGRKRIAESSLGISLRRRHAHRNELGEAFLAMIYEPAHCADSIPIPRCNNS